MDTHAHEKAIVVRACIRYECDIVAVCAVVFIIAHALDIVLQSVYSGHLRMGCPAW